MEWGANRPFFVRSYSLHMLAISKESEKRSERLQSADLGFTHHW